MQNLKTLICGYVGLCCICFRCWINQWSESHCRGCVVGDMVRVILRDGAASMICYFKQLWWDIGGQFIKKKPLSVQNINFNTLNSAVALSSMNYALYLETNYRRHSNQLIQSLFPSNSWVLNLNTYACTGLKCDNSASSDNLAYYNKGTFLEGM